MADYWMLCGNTTSERMFLATAKFVLFANKVGEVASVLKTFALFDYFGNCLSAQICVYFVMQALEPNCLRH